MKYDYSTRSGERRRWVWSRFGNQRARSRAVGDQAKEFWDKLITERKVELAFEHLQDILLKLKQKILDGSASEQEYIKAMTLVNEADVKVGLLLKREKEEIHAHVSDESLHPDEKLNTPSKGFAFITNSISVIKNTNPSTSMFPSEEQFFLQSVCPHLPFQPHTCSKTCLQLRPSSADCFKGKNPLKIPLYCRFQRRHAKRDWQVEQLDQIDVNYKAPCGTTLRNFSEVLKYLFATECDFLHLDNFSFNTYIQLDRHTQYTALDFDISNGEERVPVSLNNDIDGTRPTKFEYRKVQKLPSYFVGSSRDRFVDSCDCTNGCIDQSICACLQLTARANSKNSDPSRTRAGYQYKRLQEHAPSGTYECNVQCKCNQGMCQNRLVQHGLQTRLQVFKTEKKGWGVRCLDDIDKGTFVCTYTGKVLCNIVNHDNPLVEAMDDTVENSNSKTMSPTGLSKKRKLETSFSCSDFDVEVIEPMEETGKEICNEEENPDKIEMTVNQAKYQAISSLFTPILLTVARPKSRTAFLQNQRKQLLLKGLVTTNHTSSDEDDADENRRRGRIARFRKEKLNKSRDSPKKKVSKPLEDADSPSESLGTDDCESKAPSQKDMRDQCSDLDVTDAKSEAEMRSESFTKAENSKHRKEETDASPSSMETNLSVFHKKERSLNDHSCFIDASKEGNVGRFLNNAAGKERVAKMTPLSRCSEEIVPATGSAVSHSETADSFKTNTKKPAARKR
ncbi:histone-lysine N-methyltransferase SETDB2 isoform X2 [Latimeria chalumnae]|uniref:histone-lysine N-methyltransferase SETDB2 isoform X2 n=1 Tax=Latimeria chalumnae TaxID=7897 RepID=UPI0003C17D90|nr:PREDICTED: histone-lysine N-methyltransferase SETDB2 isoform X3 [Latimeria chalumnae]|eukprot:XP_006000612.1 PREDICTED: histone-lysine N-methyltransferase SETDB2 isoform X3 [Latimeria chalumnae]